MWFLKREKLLSYERHESGRHPHAAPYKNEIFFKDWVCLFTTKGFW